MKSVKMSGNVKKISARCVLNNKYIIIISNLLSDYIDRLSAVDTRSRLFSI